MAISISFLSIDLVFKIMGWGCFLLAALLIALAMVRPINKWLGDKRCSALGLSCFWLLVIWFLLVLM
jgi:hypothetical protein